MARPPRHTAAPSISDVARRAGVTKSTVSKALALTAGRYRVSPDTRGRVLAAARDLGFARADRAGRQHGRLALLFCGDSPNLDGINLGMHTALIAAVRDRRWEVVYQSLDRVPRDARVRALQSVDGALLVGRLPDRREQWPALIEELAVLPPAVVIDAGFDLPLPQVAPDDAGGTASLVRDLVARGHRRLGVVGRLDKPHQHGSHFRRHAAFLAAAAAAGVGAVDWCDRSDEEVVAALRRSRGGAPTALVGLSGWRFPSLWSALVRGGIDIPRRLALATADDPSFNGQMDPALTGIAWSMPGLVAAALDLLEDAIAGHAVGGTRLIPQEIRHRASTLGWHGA
jgi:LacI family transcriptional regulator